MGKTTNCLVFTQTKPEALCALLGGEQGLPWNICDSTKMGLPSPGTAAWPLCVPVLVPGWVQSQGMAWCGTLQALQEDSW